jgi:integrase/recombinase XerD
MPDAGCQALALTTDRVDLAAGVLTIASLKKRRAAIYRAVPVPLPVPPALLETLDMAQKAVAAGYGPGAG